VVILTALQPHPFHSGVEVVVQLVLLVTTPSLRRQVEPLQQQLVVAHQHELHRVEVRQRQQLLVVILVQLLRFP